MSCRLELLSEYLDGELAPRERAQMEDHLASCSECRSSLRLLTCQEEPPPLSPDFAQRVAARVLSAPAPLPWWRRTLARLSSANPVATMLSHRNLRRGAASVPWKAVLLLFALPSSGLFAVAVMDGSPEYLGGFALYTALGLLVGLPAWFLRSDVALLSSLHRGRCLEEILTANVSPSLIVDTLATHSVRAIVRAALPVAPVLLVTCMVVQPALAGLVLLWIPALALTFFTLAYVMQAAATAGYMTRLGTWSRLGYLMLLPAWVPLLLSFGPGFGWLRVPGWLALVVLMRYGAVEGLRRSLVARPAEARRTARWRLVPWTDNGIVVRELRRRSFFDAMLGMVILLPCVALVLLNEPWGREAGWIGWWAMVAASFLAASLRTLPSVVGEKEKRTWEPLLESGFPRREFVSGWLQLGILPVLLAQVPGYLLLYCVEVGLGVDAGRLLAAGWLVGGLATAAGAWLGLALSAASSTTRETGTRLVACGALVVLAWLGTCAVLLVTALLGGYLGWWNPGSQLWAGTVKYALPVAALALVSLGCLASCWWTLRTGLLLGGGSASGSSWLPTVLRAVAWWSGPALGAWLGLWLGSTAPLTQGGALQVVMGEAALSVLALALLLAWPLAPLTRCRGGRARGFVLGGIAGGMLAAGSWGLQKLALPYVSLALLVVTRRPFYLEAGGDPEVLLLAPALGALVGMRMLTGTGSSWEEGRRQAARRFLVVAAAVSVLLLGGMIWEAQAGSVKVTDPELDARVRHQAHARRRNDDLRDEAVAADLRREKEPLDRVTSLRAIRKTLQSFPYDTLTPFQVERGIERLCRFARQQAADEPEVAALAWRAALDVWCRQEVDTVFLHPVCEFPFQSALHFIDRAQLPPSVWREWTAELRPPVGGGARLGMLADCRYVEACSELSGLRLPPVPGWYRRALPERLTNQWLAIRAEVYALRRVDRAGELVSAALPYYSGVVPLDRDLNQAISSYRASLLDLERVRVHIERRLNPTGPITRSRWLPADVTIVLNAQAVTALTDEGPVTLYSSGRQQKDE